MVLHRPSDSDVVDSVGDNDTDVTKPTSTPVSHDSRRVDVASSSLPEVLRSSSPQQASTSVELVNEKCPSAVSESVNAGDTSQPAVSEPAVSDYCKATRRTAFTGLCPFCLIIRDSLNCCMYTVNHKKCATLFLIITTLAFLGRFLNFLYQRKQEGMLYKKLIKFTTSP